MKQITYVFAIFVAFILILNSCKTQETLATTNLRGDDTVTVKVKDTAFVKVTSNISTGYRWLFDENSGSKIITYEGTSFYNPTPKMIGSAGVKTFKFYAKKSGVTVVKFYKQRGTQAPVDSMIVLINVEK